MAVREVYAHPVFQRYKASFCSCGTFVIVSITLFSFIAPFFVVFWSEGLWLKEAFYREQPTVRFKHQILLLVDTQNEPYYLAWSTYQNFNLLQQQNLRIPLVKTREEDTNRDGKYDMLQFSISVPVLASENVLGVKLILLFDYRLFRFSSLHMESMAYIEHSSPLSGSELFADGELRLRLKTALAHAASDTRYNVPVISSDSVFASDYQLSKIFSDYIARNVSTYFGCPYPVWQRGPSSTGTFLIRGTVRYPEELLVYIPGFWQVLKSFWVQYLSVLIVFIAFISRVKTFIFQNQLVSTVVERPFVPKNHIM